MLSLSPHLILMQLPLLQAGQLIVVMGISFAIIHHFLVFYWQ